jgi:hypothetical protein
MLASDHQHRVPEHTTAPPRTYAVGPTRPAPDALALQRSIGKGETRSAGFQAATGERRESINAEVNRRFWERKGHIRTVLLATTEARLKSIIRTEKRVTSDKDTVFQLDHIPGARARDEDQVLPGGRHGAPVSVRPRGFRCEHKCLVQPPIRNYRAVERRRMAGIISVRDV